jgi:flagellar basal body-associated protein FliL
MGHHDNKKIQSGVIDPSQKGPTLAGMILGIIGTFLWALGIVIILFAVTATVVSFNALKKGSASQNLAAVSPVYQSKDPTLAYYDNIEQIRGQTTDEKPAVFLLRVSLGYDPADKQVSGEISLREREIQNVLLKYISGRTVTELSPAHYDDLQEGMRDAVNAIMTTAKIKSVVFREFTVVK